MATQETYQETENNDPEAAEQKPSRRSQREGMTILLSSVVLFRCLVQSLITKFKSLKSNIGT